jgi:hypothetical protein
MTIVDTRPLKKKAYDFPDPVKTLILGEPDRIDAQEFITKVATWSKLLMLESQKVWNR